MDLDLMQKTLRQFAAERDWERFHTPKNLAMALMVEVAELAEIFQWMTPEQSVSAQSDKVEQERIGDELADVLLYLLQLADQCDIDLERAVGRKLQKNAKKHPPTRLGLPAGRMAQLHPAVHVLVDWENAQPKDVDIRALVPAVTHAWIFHGSNQTRAGANQTSFGEYLTLVPIGRAGKNALDFLLSFYMGYIASRNPQARFVVVSNDQGYGPMLEHAQDLGFDTSQVGFLRPVNAAARAPAKAPVTRKTPTPAKASVKKPAPAKKPANVNAAPAVPARKSAKPKPTVAAKKTPAPQVAATKKPPQTSSIQIPVDEKGAVAFP